MTDLTPEQQQALQEKLKNMSPEELQEFQKQQCIFCQIVAGKVPAKKVYEDKDCFAVLDINPAVAGHLLLLPKEHYAILPQMPDYLVGHLFTVAQFLSRELLKKLHSDGTTFFVANGAAAGQRAQHVLLHLIPRKEGDKLLAVEEKWFGEQAKLVVPLTNALHKILGIAKEEEKGEEEKRVEEKAEEGEQEKRVEGNEQKEQKKTPKKQQKALAATPSSSKNTSSAASSSEDISLDDIARLFQ